MILNRFYQHHTGCLIANYGNSIKDFDPMRIAPALVTHATLSVMWESRAKAQGLVYSPTRMADWKHSDGSAFNPGESGLTTPGNGDDDSPVVTAVPNAMILPSGAPSSFHQRNLTQGITPEERELFPEVGAFMDAMQWMLLHNESNAITAGTKFFDWAAIDKRCFEVPGIQLATSPSCGVNGLNTSDGSVKDYHSFFANWNNSNERRSTVLAPPTIPVAPTAFIAPPTPSTTTGMDINFAKELVAALKTSNRSATEQEALADREEASLVLRLLFCRLVDNKTLPIPGTEHLQWVIALPELTKSFSEGVMLPTSNVNATKKLTALWQDTDTEAREEGPFGRHLVTVHHARGTLVTEFFTAQVRTAQWSTKPMEQYLSQATQNISLLLFAPPHMTASQYEEHMSYGCKVQSLVTQGEDAKNQAKKQTSFAPKVHLKRKEDLDETVAAVWAFERMAVAHSAPATSQLVTGLSYALDKFSLGSGATQWHQLNEECGHAMVHIFLEFQAAFRSYCAFATSPGALKAAKGCTDGYILDEELIGTLRDLQMVVKNGFHQAANQMTKGMPIQWKEESPAAKYFSYNSPALKRSAFPSVSPEKPSPAKKQRGSNDYGANSPAQSSSNQGREGKFQPAEKLVLSPEEVANRKSQGLLIVKDGLQGHEVRLDLSVKAVGAAQSRYICKGHTIKGMACHFANCRHFHLNSLQDLEPDSASKLRAFIAGSQTLNWSNPREANGGNRQG